MQEMGISTKVISSGHHHDYGVECQANGESLVGNVNGGSSLGKSEDTDSDILIGSANTEQLVCGTDGSPNSRKRQRVDGPQAGQSAAVEATESSILRWLENFDDGVSTEPLQSMYLSHISIFFLRR